MISHDARIVWEWIRVAAMDPQTREVTREHLTEVMLAFVYDIESARRLDECIAELREAGHLRAIAGGYYVERDE